MSLKDFYLIVDSSEKKATALLREHDLLDTVENILIKKGNITVEDYILNSDLPVSSKDSDAELHIVVTIIDEEWTDPQNLGFLA